MIRPKTDRAKTKIIMFRGQTIYIKTEPSGMVYSECAKPRWGAVVPYEHATHGIKPTMKKIMQDINFLLDSSKEADKSEVERIKRNAQRSKRAKKQQSIKRLELLLKVTRKRKQLPNKFKG